MTRIEVPAHDLVAQYHTVRDEIAEALEQVLASGEYERGETLWAFEDAVAARVASAHAIGVGSGQAALQIALKALGIGPGDEVITVANTDISTASAIRHCGADVVFVDVDASTFNIDCASLEAAITPRTAAIVAVHLYGLPADLDAVAAIAARHRLALVEDAALAFGATIGGRPVGALGDIGCFSFAPHKILGGYGDGGIVVTNRADLAKRVRVLGGYGEPQRESMVGPNGRLQIVEEGFHSHLDLLQAAILQVKLRHVDDWIAARRRNAALYDALLERSEVIAPAVPDGTTHVYRNYVVRVRERDRVRAELLQAGIETALLYVPPLHLQPVYESLGYRTGSLPVTEQLADELLCLPVYPELSEIAVRRVAAELLRTVERPQQTRGVA